MSVVAITDVKVLDNPTRFLSPYQFEITFECISPLKEDLEFKIIYVGSPEEESYDQVLESVLVGPIPPGVNKFTLQADPPKPELLPEENIYGVTVILLTCSYLGREFVRVGYYVNNEYLDEGLRAARAQALADKKPPPEVQVDKLYRNILSEKPKVTRFTIDWDTPGSAEKLLQSQVEQEVGASTMDTI